MYPPPGQDENSGESQPQYGFPPPNTEQPGGYPPPGYQPPPGTYGSPPPGYQPPPQGYNYPQYQQPPQPGYGYPPYQQQAYYQPQYVRTSMSSSNKRIGLGCIIFLVFFVVIFGAIGFFAWSIFSQAKDAIKSVTNSTAEVSVYPGAESLALKDSYKSTATITTNLKIQVYATGDSADKVADFFKKEINQKGYTLSIMDTNSTSRGYRQIQGFGINGASTEVRILSPSSIADATTDTGKTQGKTVFVVLSSNPLEGVFD